MQSHPAGAVVMTGTRPEQTISFNLFLLPREKPLLDFMLKELAQRSGPERYELIEALLHMYRVSAGFDPFALSKGRFRRIKAAEFRQVLLEIDREIGVVMQTEAYQRMEQSHLNAEAMFREYAELSQGVSINPAQSMTGELEQFEQHLHDAEMPELLLLFYRQHRRFLDELFSHDAPLKALERFEQVAARQTQLQQHFRMSFHIRALELEADKGLFYPDKAKGEIARLERMLVQESSPKWRAEMTWNMIRLSLLTVRPSETIHPYLEALAADMNSFLRFMPDSSIRMWTVLASWHYRADRCQRMEWLKQAGEKARELELHEMRPGFRFVGCQIECDAGDYEAALKSLHEAEHLTYKTPARSPEARNNWITLCEYRTVLYALQCLHGDRRHEEQFVSLRNLASNMGRHRHEIAVMMLEWQALESFVHRRWKETRELLERAISYRSDQPSHPWYLLDRCLLAVLGKGKSRRGAAILAIELEQAAWPFYSSAGGALLKSAFEFVSASVKQQ